MRPRQPTTGLRARLAASYRPLAANDDHLGRRYQDRLATLAAGEPLIIPSHELPHAICPTGYWCVIGPDDTVKPIARAHALAAMRLDSGR